MRLSPAQYRALTAKKKPTAKWPGKMTESQQQAASVAWFRAEYPELARCLFAIPNGGKRSKREAAQFVREGVLAGVPDTFLAVARDGFNGLFVEQKIKGNKPTENQANMMAILTAHGYKCVVVYSLDEFKEAIQEYLK